MALISILMQAKELMVDAYGRCFLTGKEIPILQSAPWLTVDAFMVDAAFLLSIPRGYAVDA